MANGYIYGEETASNAVSTTQVYKATHDKNNKYLSYMNRAFISFSYGGKNIEDFNLIAIIENNEIQRNVYADFTDNVSTSTIYDGQVYWSTHHDTNSLELTLVTDEMEERQLDEFKKWFKPGRIEELILSEHPNRGILARINQPPVIRLLPFEKKVKFPIRQMNINNSSSINYNTSTTVYKGFINLSFIMDDPYWYALNNVLDFEYDEAHDYYISTNNWNNANNESESVLVSSDALKIIYEDHVPITSMLNITEAPIDFGTKVMSSATVVFPLKVGIGTVNGGYQVVPNMDYMEDTVGVKILNDEKGYFYYAGTAPCYPKVILTLQPTLNNDGYINFPANEFGSTNGKVYNTLTIESKNKSEFKFTTPSVFDAYNKALYILKNTSNEVSLEELRDKIRDNIKHYCVREFVIKFINDKNNITTILDTAKATMKKFLCKNNDIPDECTFTFDGSTGTANGKITVYNYNGDQISLEVENVEDMVYSSYLLITDRNVFTSEGTISYWTQAHPDYSYRFYADCPIKNIRFKYKYLYL